MEIETLTREQAQASGYYRYYPGTPCARGHMAWHFTRTGRCQRCILLDAHAAKRPASNKKSILELELAVPWSMTESEIAVLLEWLEFQCIPAWLKAQGKLAP
jgi:hypothetical protein